MAHNELIVYCDGACFPNPGKGGWGWVTEDRAYFDSGHIARATNQVMELKAAIEATKRFAEANRLLIVRTDSQYVVNGITTWIHDWVQNDWHTQSGQPVKNQDLWFELLLYTAHSLVKFEWVRGHDGNSGNEEADKLATLASKANPELIKKLKAQWHKKPAGI